MPAGADARFQMLVQYVQHYILLMLVEDHVLSIVADVHTASTLQG
jgi:hypothetical protein